MLTDSVTEHLRSLARAVLLRRHPILLQVTPTLPPAPPPRPFTFWLLQKFFKSHFQPLSCRSRQSSGPQ